ncbi:hypothetical protein GDO78_000700 [Eleutherodactylus coqui]|uniref:Uncharacterized protein n=1 Tax=Eleutherodactylus coqui TaxID=57060 RepID=A0A8J6FQP2_ELECQ|nr:hypothetical protein GDO78_000700 [Eleutherodactylus coqui]
MFFFLRVLFLKWPRKGVAKTKSYPLCKAKLASSYSKMLCQKCINRLFRMNPKHLLGLKLKVNLRAVHSKKVRLALQDYVRALMLLPLEWKI